MLRFRLEKLRTRCYGLWTDLEDKANFELYPADDRLWDNLSPEVDNGRIKELRTPHLVYLAHRYIHSN